MEQAPICEAETINTVLEMPEQTEKPAKKKDHVWKHKNVNGREKSFASGLNGYKLIWVFLVGSFIGVLFETFYVHHMEGVWMRRSGMLYGPFNQIYGMGAVLFSVVLYRFRNKNALLIFFASALMGGTFEYLSNWGQELLFGSVSWEYSKMPMNIGGRTNVFYMFGWGIMGVLFIMHIWPFLSEMIERIPNKIGKPLTLVLAVIIGLDLLLSGMAVLRESQRKMGEPATNVVEVWLDKTYPDNLMKEKYPSMQFKSDAEPKPAEAASQPADEKSEQK